MYCVAAWIFSREGTVLAGAAGESPAHCEQGSHRGQTPAFGVATWEVTLSAQKVVPASVGLQPVLLRTVYSQAQGCVCTALQLGGTLTNIGL